MNKPLNLLIVELPPKDEQSALTSFLRRQPETYSCVNVTTLSEISTEYTAAGFDLILLDFILWDEIIMSVMKQFADVPILLIADQGDEQNVAAIIHQGVADVLFRDTNNNFHHLLPFVIDRIQQHKHPASEDDILVAFAKETEQTLKPIGKEQLRNDVLLRLTDSVAHDLSNVLSPILGFSKMLLDETDSKDSNFTLISEIVDSAVRAQAIVRQLSIFKAKKAGDFVQVDMGELLENMRMTLQRTLEKGTEVEVIIHGLLPAISGDIALLEQAVMHCSLYLQNSMPQTKKLYLNIAPSRPEKQENGEREVESETYLVLSVTTTKSANWKTQPSTRSEQQADTGLSLVKAIVRQHDGFLSNDTANQGGINILLPTSDAIPISTSSEMGQQEPGKCSETILILESISHLNRLIALALEERGYSIFTAEDNNTALEIFDLHQQKIDLVLVDMATFENGDNFITQIQQYREKHFKLAYLVPRHELDGMEDLDAHLIGKPFALKALIDTVRSILDEDKNIS